MPESIKLYLDEDTLSRALINALRARGVDLLSAHEAGLESAPDQEHLALATALGRSVFTFNTRDFANLHARGFPKGSIMLVLSSRIKSLSGKL